MRYVLPTPIVLKFYFKPTSMQRLFALCFPYFINAMENICELYVNAMFIMFALFLGYLNSKQTVPYSLLLYKLYFSPM